jgi:hypothetical protein
MDYGRVLKRALEMGWRYRALWLFGAILALTTVNGFYFGYDRIQDEDWYQTGARIPIKVNEDTTIYLPGEGLAIDLTDPGGISIEVNDQEWQEFKELFTEVIPRDVWTILIAFGVVLGGMIVVGLIARYVAEAALIRMVNDTEETGETLGVGRGLRLGFSRSAGRLFLIDLLINLPLTLASILLFLLALSPLLLWISGSTAAGIAGTTATAGMLFLVIALLVVISVVLSPLMQVIRRACGVEGLGVIASIRRGFAVARGHLKETVVVWLIWIGIRLLWMFATVPVIIVLLPVTLLFIVVGAVLGAVPAVVVGGLLTLFFEGAVPWIVGAVAGLPVFILIMIAPMLFLGGLVEVVKSSIWTLTYRELGALESAEREPAPEAGISGLEAAPAG